MENKTKIEMELTKGEFEELKNFWEDAKVELVYKDGSPYDASIEDCAKELLFERIREL